MRTPIGQCIFFIQIIIKTLSQVPVPLESIPEAL